MAHATPAGPAPRRRSSHLLLGDLKQFQEDPLALMLEIARDYGPVTRLRFGPATQHVVTHPDGVRHVLQRNNRNYIKEQQFMEIARLALGSGDDLFTSDGNEWLRRRRLLQPAFHRQVVSQFTEQIVAETERMLAGWRPGQALDLEREMMDLTMGIIGQTMLSEDLLEGQPGLHGAFTEVSGFIVDRATRLSRRFLPLGLPLPSHQAFQGARATIRVMLGEIVAAREAQPEEDRPPDLLTMMMAACDEDSGAMLTREQLLDELFGIVSAGHETSSITLAWLFYTLAAHPEAAAPLYAEVDRQLHGRPPTAADLPQMPYLAAVLDETLRCFPAAYLTTRQAVDGDEVCGYSIPAGAMVLINIYGLHHHPAWWQQPDRFRPERFLPESDDQVEKFAFIPFGEGPRKCLGEPLARLEMALITALVVQRFHLEQIPERPARLQARFTLRAENGAWMVPVERGR